MLMRLVAIGLSVGFGPAWAGAAAEAWDAAALDAALAKLPTLPADGEFDARQQAQAAIQTHVRLAPSDAERKKALSARLLQLLAPNVAVPTRRFACRMLSEIGAAESVAPLAALLGDEQVGEMARYALERIPDGSAGAALREAAGKLKGLALVGVLNSLGERGEPEAVAVLATFAAAPDQAVAAAALAALGRIGNEDAAKALDVLAGSAPAEAQGLLLDARLECAGKLLEAGKEGPASAVYEKLQAAPPPPRAQPAIVRGLLLTKPADRFSIAMEALKFDNPAVRALGGWFATSLADAGGLNQLAGELSGLPAPAKAVLLHAFALRRHRPAEPDAITLTKSDDAGVRAAAIEALKDIGSAKAIPALISVAAEKTGDEQALALASLAQLRDETVNKELTALLGNSAPPLQAVLARVLAERAAGEAIPALLELAAKSTDAAVQAAAIDALAGWPNAEPAERLLALADKAPTDKQKDLALQGYLKLAQSAGSGTAAQRVALCRKAVPFAKRKQDKALILSALSQIAGVEALLAARGFLTDEMAKEDACAALLRLAPALDAAHKDEAVAALKAVLEATKDQRLVKRAKDALQKLGVQAP